MAWNSEGGGFEVGTGTESSPSISRDRGGQEKNGIKPICIKTIHRSFVDDNFKAADDSALSQVTVVGKVLESESNSQRFEYKIGDASGETLLAREYINDEDVQQPTLISPGQYARLYGTLKSFQGAPHIVINRIHEIKDPNEITMHLLEMTYTYLKMKKVGSSGPGGAVDKSADVNDQVRMTIQSNKTMTGISISEIKEALPHLTSDQIMAAINFLSSEGFIFSTVDDDHYRATEDA